MYKRSVTASAMILARNLGFIKVKYLVANFERILNP